MHTPPRLRYKRTHDLVKKWVKGQQCQQIALNVFNTKNLDVLTVVLTHAQGSAEGQQGLVRHYEVGGWGAADI